MSPTLTIILIIVVLVVVAAVLYGIQVGRRKKLRNTFGPEYDRTVEHTGNRTEAEKELREREKRHAALELKPLSPESQARYAAAWEEVQIQFVDSPAEAVTTADELVTRLIAERGYPTGDYDEKLADLSVEHAGTLQHYRDAHEISERNKGGEASTEDLRQALVPLPGPVRRPARHRPGPGRVRDRHRPYGQAGARSPHGRRRHRPRQHR